MSWSPGEACPAAGCGSSDAFKQHSDGHWHCFSCGFHRNNPDEATPVSGDLLQIDHEAWDDQTPQARRGISAETARKYGYGVVYHQGVKAHAATYHDAQGRPVGQKLRLPKGPDGKKRITWVGSPTEATLFGQRLWGNGGQYLTITEGEVDCLSAFEANGRKYPVVSIRNGAQAALKDIMAQLEWVESFDRVVLMFDMDEPGRAAASEVATSLAPGKAYVAELPEKDVNEVLLKQGSAAIQQAFWNAKPYRPDGIVAGKAIWQHVRRPLPKGLELPHVGLQAMLRGLRPSELWLFGAGSGAGKSSFCRELAVHYALNHDLRVGYVALEETVQRSALGILSILEEQRLHLEEQLDVDGLESNWGKWVEDHFVFYDHFGSVEGSALMAKIRYLAKAEKVDLIVLDHISIAVSGLEVTDERKALDVLMTRLRSLVQETGVSMLVVSHLKRVAGKEFERMGEVNMADFRGSAGLEQMSDVIIGQERNMQAEDPQDRDYTRLRVVKNRPVGETGVAGWLRFSRTTGRLLECEAPGTDDAERMEPVVSFDPLMEVPF